MWWCRLNLKWSCHHCFCLSQQKHKLIVETSFTADLKERLWMGIWGCGNSKHCQFVFSCFSVCICSTSLSPSCSYCRARPRYCLYHFEWSSEMNSIMVFYPHAVTASWLTMRGWSHSFSLPWWLIWQYRVAHKLYRGVFMEELCMLQSIYASLNFSLSHYVCQRCKLHPEVPLKRKSTLCALIGLITDYPVFCLYICTQGK